MEITGVDKLAMPIREAAKALSISERTLWSLTSPRGPIRCVRAGTRVLYPLATLQAWIDSQLTAAKCSVA